MIYEASSIAIILFIGFVISVLGISYYCARKTKSSEGYFAAGGQIHWAVNGIAFAGDYLSAASFLGICGMIAVYGYDGFLYSIGYLAGWIVALFVIAEPMKRLGKYTFTDALDSKFNSKGIQLAAAISTLIVSMCYLIPQMVGAGALVTPLLGLPHYVGVFIVGTIVVIIVATAGMASTTYVQFIKGALLLVFSIVLTILIIRKGIVSKPSKDFHVPRQFQVSMVNGKIQYIKNNSMYKVVGEKSSSGLHFIKLKDKDGIFTWWKLEKQDGRTILSEALSKTYIPGKAPLYNGMPKEKRRFYSVGNVSKIIVNGKEVKDSGKLGVFSFLATVQNSEILRFLKTKIKDGKNTVVLWHQIKTAGREFMRPGQKFKVDKGSTFMSKLNFISLMLALFFGTAALPHILIRYYTVPSQRDARKSTIVAIIGIGLFYILTMYMGLGAAVNGVLDPESSNMSAPLIARYFGVGLFAIVSAIAFATVLGTVSGLIVAASGAVAHDIISQYMGVDLSDKGKVKAGKIAAIVVGFIAVILGIIFKGMNVSFLVGWAFAIAASANLPAILMLLFWKKTNAKGITASIFVGMITALGLILISPVMYERYGLNPASALISLNNPGIISIPLSFLTLIVVSLATQEKKQNKIKKGSSRTSLFHIYYFKEL